MLKHIVLSLILSHFDCESTWDPSRSLLITDLSVVESSFAQSDNAWSLAGVLDRLKPKDATLEEFLFSWLSEWDQRTSINGFEVRPRISERLLGLWPKFSDGSLDLRHAPFRLLAIVNRADLMEGRFVFGAFDPETGQPADFSMIIEFPLNMAEDQFKQYQMQWGKLSKLSFGPTFTRQLLKLSEQWFEFSKEVRIRSNDFLMLFEWELREFERDRDGWFRVTTTKQTPDFSLDQSLELRSWIVENQNLILNGDFSVPSKFLGGAAPVPADSFRWMLDANLDENLRRSFSQQTCSGCHAGDTFTPFHHIAPRRADYPADLSPFLIDDLARRALNLTSILCAESGSHRFVGAPRIGSRVH